MTVHRNTCTQNKRVHLRSYTCVHIAAPVHKRQNVYARLTHKYLHKYFSKTHYILCLSISVDEKPSRDIHEYSKTMQK